MKIFLSHSTHDGDFAKRLAAALESANFTPWLCEVDIDFGDDFIHKINEGLADAAFILLIWSPEAAASPWTRKEWEAALHREVSESVTRLGVVKLRTAELPPLLLPKVHADASDDEAEAIAQVVAAMLRHRAKLQPAAASVPRPVAREPEGFVGRGPYLDRLYTELVEREGVFLLHGTAGAGKSTIGLKALWQWRGRFERALFVTCGQRTASEAASDLARQIGLDVRGLAPERTVAAVRDSLSSQRNLVVLDDVWRTDIADLLPAAPASVLLTSRWRSWEFVAPGHALEVHPFSEDETERVLCLWLGDAEVERHHGELLELARRWDRLPVAVVVAADLLRRQFGAWDEAARGLVLAELRNGVHDVPALMRRAVAGLDPPERKLLEAAAYCAADGFWMPLAVSIAELSDAEGKAARDRLAGGSLLRMLDRERQRFYVHAALREVVRLDGDLEGLAARHVAAVEAVFADGEKRWRDCRECFGEVIPAVRWLAGRGEMRRMSSLAYQGFDMGRRIGELEEAFQVLSAEESVWQTAREGGAEEELQRVYGNQALILRAWGRLEEAMALHKKQEAIGLELGDKNSLQASYGNQALILQAWGRLEEAMALHKKQEVIGLEFGDKNSLQASYGNQALILQAWGRLEEAMALLKKQEAICLELGNKNSVQIGYGNQALILQDWGRLEEAMALLKKQEAICLELGNKDSLQRSYGNQALILQDWGRLEEAMALLKRQEAICLELGNKNDLQRSYGNQALILQAWGRLEEAMALLEKQEAICLELGLQAALAYSWANQGRVLNAQKNAAAARDKWRSALEIFTRLKMPRQRDGVQTDLGSLGAEG